MTHNKAPHSGVDEKNLHGVAHRKRCQDEQRREGFSLSSAPSKFVLILIIALAFFACDDNTETHTHEWGAWQSNATEHWKECSCGEEYGRANHTGDPCTVCGYEIPDDWEDTIALFDGYTATVKGIALLPSEWNGVANKVETAINGAQSDATGGTSVRFDSVFNSNDVVIIVEKTTAYKCKVNDGEFSTLYLSLNYLNDTGLQATITSAVNRMANKTEGGYKLE